MNTKVHKALLVGESLSDSSSLAAHMHERGFQCEFASSSQRALSLTRIHDFDLVLSPIRLRDASLFFLMDLLDGSEVTLFYFQPVETGCVWLPAIRRGRRCFGLPALRPDEFASVLDAAIDEIRCGLAVTGGTPQSLVQRAAMGWWTF
jgi:hypothetical protein